MQRTNEKIRRHCCLAMTAQLTHRCPEHLSPFDCPDALVWYQARFDEYGLIIHDGGTSVQAIQYCPWCGTALPASKRDRWFEALAALGYDDPETQAIPEIFMSDVWYRRNSAAEGRQQQIEQGMTTIRLMSTAITDWHSFHTLCQEQFGFPSFYGRNMNAWIDCMSDIDEGNGMTGVPVQPGEKVVVEVIDAPDLLSRVPDVVVGLMEGAAVVNQRMIAAGKATRIVLVFQ